MLAFERVGHKFKWLELTRLATAIITPPHSSAAYGTGDYLPYFHDAIDEFEK